MPSRSLNWFDQLATAGVPKRLVERRIAQTGLGVVRALRGSTMSIDDAEADLFNLDTYRAMRRRRLSPQLIEFMQWGMELADVAEVAPAGLEKSYRRMEALVLGVISATLASRRPTRRRKRA